MRSLFRDIITSLLMGLILPGILLNTADYILNHQKDTPQVQETVPETTEVSAHVPVMIRKEDAPNVQMDLEEYLVGVVLAEMPASFELEALKAQAIAARTYTRKVLETGGKHGDGSLCTKPSCCQAYISEDDYLIQGGIEEGVEKIQSAVTSTAGCVLIYQGELIEATYFSCSGGTTEDAAAVWGTDFPYLQSVPSPGEESAAHYTDTVVFSKQEFQNALGRILQGAPASWFGPVAYTEGGGVASMIIGEESYTGTQLRSLLNLRSTNFTVEAEENIRITTYGYGHRVGMSQYGADAMAVSGSTCEEILAHYYPGAAMVRLEQE